MYHEKLLQITGYATLNPLLKASVLIKIETRSTKLLDAFKNIATKERVQSGMWCRAYVYAAEVLH